jgi:uracil-DNA glycosylase
VNLVERITACKKCPDLLGRKNVVVGEGVVPARCVFLGEGPGEKEDEAGFPFVGRAGKLLRSCMSHAGFKPGDYHILNCVKCRPPENRNPTEKELENCRPFLVKQLIALNPKVIVAMGKFAQAFILEQDPNEMHVSANAGSLIQYNTTTRALLTYHPSYVARHQADEVYFTFLRHISRAYKLSKGTP